jgi:hypothetical protein
MSRKPYGKYDDLTPDERRHLLARLHVEIGIWGGVGLALMPLDHYRVTPGYLAFPLELVIIGAMLRVVQLLFRRIAVLSPNPKRQPPNSAAPADEPRPDSTER